MNFNGFKKKNHFNNAMNTLNSNLLTYIVS